jgi:hypothetical protein
MRYAVIVCVLLVSLAGCSGVLEDSPEPTTSQITTEESSEQASEVPTPALPSTIELVDLNVESVPLSGNYTLTRSPNQSNTELGEVSNIAKSQKNIFARKSDSGGRNPIAVQSTIVLVEQASHSSSVATEILSLYTEAEDAEFTNGRIQSFEYTTPGGYEATISIVTYQNAVIYTTEVGGDDHYTRVTEDVTERALRQAEQRGN